MQKVKKFTTTQEAVLTTLLYSDIFSFPLTKDELWQYLIAEKKISRDSFDNSLKSLEMYIFYKESYFCLQKREEIIERRKQNLHEVEKKMKRASLIAEKLSHIPSILFIGISGGLAVGNATEQDDIDLVIITRKNKLFVTRMLVLTILELLGIRRSRNQIKTADTICVNLLLDETALGWFGNYKDIYTAREISQLLPLFERVDTYKRFVNANLWIERFLPNAVNLSSMRKVQDDGVEANQNDDFGFKIISHIIINSFFEIIFRTIQMSLMKRHQTTEIINNHLLAFHPNDYRAKTLKQLRLKVRQLGLLTKL